MRWAQLLIRRVTVKFPASKLNLDDFGVNQELLNSRIRSIVSRTVESSVTSVELVFVLSALFVVPLFIAAAIGYAAWRGKPKRFDREMYWTAFVSAGALAALIIVYSMRMQADIKPTRHILGLMGLGLGGVVFGVALGCCVGVFTYRRNSVSANLPT